MIQKFDERQVSVDKNVVVQTGLGFIVRKILVLYLTTEHKKGFIGNELVHAWLGTEFVLPKRFL